MSVILGPVPCQGCRRPVAYAPSCRHAGDEVEPHGALRWTDPETGRAHRCRARARNEPGLLASIEVMAR